MAEENIGNAPILEAKQSLPPTKTNWPELMGMKAEDVEKKIKEEMPRATVHVIPQDSFVTMDFVSSRVRLFIDSSQNVVKAPRIG
ncbi:subtilisin inhibitor-like [Cynara cardunculus var. scolymus]|uniref:subtilisin inhibitor-like n=1 Tax=Cynara cardunculus var. scolymus TaxID=59895 RepID=UPI000D62476E|nr:subtilisin inhibitor-like [Cynara cardunculus var. scolymus]